MCHSVEIFIVAEPACLLFCVELLAVLVIQFNANTNKLSAWFSSSNSLLCLVRPAETWMKIHFTFWRKESCSGRARSRRAECWQAEGGSWYNSSIFREHHVACIIHMPSKGEMRGKCFPLCYLTNTWKRHGVFFSQRKCGCRVCTDDPYLAVAVTRISRQPSWGVLVPQARLTELTLI